MSKPKCGCGCGQRAANRHHIVTQAQLRAIAGRERDKAKQGKLSQQLTHDRRNLVWLAFSCHMNHHARSGVLPLVILPDSAFEFAVETLGAGLAYETLRRAYRGTDVRLDALLEMAA